MIKTEGERKDKIKVMRIIARLNVGGPAVHVILLNAGLDKERFLSYLVTGIVAEGERDVAHLAQERGVDPLIIPEFTREIRLNNDFRTLLKLYKLMRRLKPDIVHTHTAKAGALGRIAAILNRVPIRIHTFHGHIFHSYFGRVKTYFFIMIEKILARFTNKIIVISQSQLSDVKDVYRIAPRNKCSIIPLGLELEQFLKAKGYKNIKDTLQIDKDALLIGIVGRLVKVKNHRMFLDVAKRTREKSPDIKVRFLIVGDGTLKKELEAYARKLGIEDLVIFTGWRADLVDIYKSLDIVCLTSLNEGTPISLIEAMASGRPVVSTDVGGVKDIVVHGESGFLSPSGDGEAFTSHLLTLLRDREKRDQMGTFGRAYVSESFPKERLLKDIEDLYEKEFKCHRGGIQ